VTQGLPLSGGIGGGGPSLGTVRAATGIRPTRDTARCLRVSDLVVWAVGMKDEETFTRRRDFMAVAGPWPRVALLTVSYQSP
jgi:hypothetical protein